MKRWMTGILIAVLPGTSWAQAPGAPTGLTQQQQRQLKESRYQIAQMERVLEGAVEHGATLMRDQLRAALPADMLLTENARVRGFRLDGYGVFFDVEVPSLEGPLPWSFDSLNRTNLGVQAALQTIRTFIEGSGSTDANVRQALKRVELQVAPLSDPGDVGQALSPAVSQEEVNQAYRATISSALVDAMLEHARGLGVASNEFLTVAARGSDSRPKLAPADTPSQTVLIRFKGADLSAFLGGQISREEARRLAEVRVF